MKCELLFSIFTADICILYRKIWTLWGLIAARNDTPNATSRGKQDSNARFDPDSNAADPLKC